MQDNATTEEESPQTGQRHYEVAVIGAGPGGYVAAIKAAQLGLTVVLIEQGEVGGTCLNRGCIPTKTLLHTAELFEATKQAEHVGLSIEHAAIDYTSLRAHKDEVCTTLRTGIEQLLKAWGVELIRGRASVLSPTQVLVEQDVREADEQSVLNDHGQHAKHMQGQEHDSLETAREPAEQPHAYFTETFTLTTKNIIIATGTRPQLPAIEGVGLPGVYTSDTLLAEVPAVKRLAVIGGGVIGMEFASMYVAFGSEVTVLISSDYPLRSLDKELGQSLAMQMKKQGTAIITRATVTKIESVRQHNEQGGEHTALRVHYRVKDEDKAVEVDAVLLAKGREAVLDQVLAEGVAPAREGGKIAVDAQMRTSIKGIYAIGDVSNADSELAHAASAEGELAVATIAGVPCTRRLDTVPVCVYTSPEIACVGMTEAAAKQAGLSVKVGKYPMGSNAKTLIAHQGRSFIKIVADEQGQVRGAQLMCARATDIVGELALGIAAGMTVSEMLEIVRPHPTFEEAVGEALEAVTGSSLHSMPRRH